MAKTNSGLVEYAIAQLGRPYWYGTFGQIASQALLNAKSSQYPYYYDQSRYKVKFTSQFGQKVHDCVGLIKGYLWCAGPDSGSYTYNASQDVSANGMRDACKEKGSMDSMPDQGGILVFKSGHVGVYIGGGIVVEAMGHDYGVVKTKLSDRGWTSWGKCPWISYGDAPVPVPTDGYTVHTNSGDALRLRREPNTDSEQVGWIPNGVTVRASEVVNGESIGGVTAWIKTTYNGATGYASGKYLTPTPKVEEPKPEPAPAKHTGYPATIRRGDKNNAVKIWQVIVGCDDDGDFGPITESYTTKFQRSHKDLNGNALEVDGIVGPKTWAAGLDNFK